MEPQEPLKIELKISTSKKNRCVKFSNDTIFCSNQRVVNKGLRAHIKIGSHLQINTKFFEDSLLDLNMEDNRSTKHKVLIVCRRSFEVLYQQKTYVVVRTVLAYNGIKPKFKLQTKHYQKKKKKYEEIFLSETLSKFLAKRKLS